MSIKIIEISDIWYLENKMTSSYLIYDQDLITEIASSE